MTITRIGASLCLSMTGTNWINLLGHVGFPSDATAPLCIIEGAMAVEDWCRRRRWCASP